MNSFLKNYERWLKNRSCQRRKKKMKELSKRSRRKGVWIPPISLLSSTFYNGFLDELLCTWSTQSQVLHRKDVYCTLQSQVLCWWEASLFFVLSSKHAEVVGYMICGVAKCGHAKIDPYRVCITFAAIFFLLISIQFFFLNFKIYN